jgi:hypothetical protein
LRAADKLLFVLVYLKTGSLAASAEGEGGDPSGFSGRWAFGQRLQRRQPPQQLLGVLGMVSDPGVGIDQVAGLEPGR